MESPDEWRSWSLAAQQRALDALRDIENSVWKPFYCRKPGCDGKPHDKWEWRHARADQHPPKGDWFVWLMRGGRGSGKTRTGSEWTQRRIKISPIIALVAPTGPAARDVMIEGESGILATSPPGGRPLWEPSKRKLTWPNGAVGHTYSGEEPDRLRGPQHYDAWLDEPAHMALIDEVWQNLTLGMRLGSDPKVLCTTTPVPSQWMKGIVKRDDTVSVVASTYANIDNLAPAFAKKVLEELEGTRRGRQEIYGEILEDVEGALWNAEMIEAARVQSLVVDLVRIVVAIDPAGSANARSDETGIVVVGVDEGGQFYVLYDGSGRLTPNGWATRAVELYERFSADYIVAERNFGGDMVKNTLDTLDSDARVVTVNSRRGKVIRADPVVALYEKGRVSHVGLHPDLEDQLTTWVPGTTSPDRLDALVHGITDLRRGTSPVTIASPSGFDLPWQQQW